MILRTVPGAVLAATALGRLASFDARPAASTARAVTAARTRLENT